MPGSGEPKKPDDASNHSDCRDPRASGGMKRPHNSSTDSRKENDPSPAKRLPGYAPHSSECVKSGSGTLVHCHAVFSPAMPSPIHPTVATTDSRIPAPLPLLTPPPSHTNQSHFSPPLRPSPLRTSPSQISNPHHQPQALDCCQNYSSLCARSAPTRPLPTRPHQPQARRPLPLPPTPHELCRMRGCTPVALTRPPT